MPLAAGSLRRVVQLQRKALDSNGEPLLDTNGEQVDEWETFATVWASIAPLSAREFVASQKTDSEVTARITIRYRADVNATVRILHGTTIYNIAGVLADPLYGNEYLTLPCTQGINQG